MNFNQLSKKESILLETPFSYDEIKDVVWLNDGDKSPGPDEFNLSFFKTCWEYVGQKAVNYVDKIYWNANLPKAITNSFLYLSLKSDNH